MLKVCLFMSMCIIIGLILMHITWTWNIHVNFPCRWVRKMCELVRLGRSRFGWHTQINKQFFFNIHFVKYLLGFYYIFVHCVFEINSYLSFSGLPRKMRLLPQGDFGLAIWKLSLGRSFQCQLCFQIARDKIFHIFEILFSYFAFDL